MPFSYVDFAIASGIFLIFLSVFLGHVVNYITSYWNEKEVFELKTVASTIFNTFFADEGLPKDWEKKGLVPVKVGLVGKLYMVVINITETSGNYRENLIINGSIEFDKNCERNILNNTVRLYNSSNSQIPFQLYNQTFCEGGFLKKAEIVFKTSLEPSQSHFFFLYFSSEKNVEASNYSLDFSVNENYTFQTFPAQELKVISVDKLMALKNLSYEEVLQTIQKGYEFMVEIS
jgi:hypothetical protein